MKQGHQPPAGRVEIADATIDDLQHIAALHLECLRPDANLASLLGPSFVRATYEWFLTAKEAYVIKATIDGELAGFTSICDVPYTMPMLMACRRVLIRCLLVRPWLLLNPRIQRRIWRRHGGRGTPNMGQGIAQVGFTAVAPKFRGRGIGTTLKMASIGRCRQRGSKGLITGISRSNFASIALNERFGFRPVEEAATTNYCYYLLRFTSNPGGEMGGTSEDPQLPTTLRVQGS